MDFPSFLASLARDVDAFAVPGVTESTELARLPAWDSLAVLLTLTHLQDVHGVVTTGTQLRACRTVGDLARLARKTPA